MKRPARRVLLLAAAALAMLVSRGASAEEAAAPRRQGLSAGIDGGLNQWAPFGGAQVAWRFRRADFFELHVDYAYSAAISEFTFHTLGVGTRTYFANAGRFEVYHQALLGLALSSGGTAEVPERDLGERLLGAFMTQGIGVDVAIAGGLHGALSISTGYPIWFRPELGLRWRFR